MQDYKQRTIDAPGQEWYTREQAARWLDMTEDEFSAHVKSGFFPPPCKRGPRKFYYHWEQLYLMNLLLKYHVPPELREEKKEKNLEGD